MGKIMAEIRHLAWNDIRNLLAAEHEAHVAEIQSETYRMKYNPDWEIYQGLFEAGRFLSLAAFVQGLPAGYLNVILAPVAHSQGVLVASADSFFVHPQFRRGNIMSQLVEVAERMCKDAGATSLSLNVMYDKGNGAEFVEALGYKPAEVTYTKILED